MVLPPMIRKQEVTKGNEPISTDISAFHEAIVNGNLGQLTKQQQATYLMKLTESLGLNSMTRPFAFIELQGKMTVYALKECAAQLAKRDCVSVRLAEYRFYPEQNFLEVVATASDPSGRTTDEVAAVTFSAALKGDAAANARMKLATKAKRRAILAHCGLGFLDESELETVPNKKEVNHEPLQNKTSKGNSESITKTVEQSPVPAMVRVNDNDTSIFVDSDDSISNPIEQPISALNFDYNNTNDRQWLIAMIKQARPNLLRPDIITLAKTFAKHTTKAEVEKDLK